MRQRTFRLIFLSVSTFMLLFITGLSALGAGTPPIQQASEPNPPLTHEQLEAFWQEMYPSSGDLVASADTNTYQSELLAKATPDECYFDYGVRLPVTDTALGCESGIPKVNEAYVWGMTDYEETIWFGTAPNVHCLVMGGFLGASVPIETDSYVCEFGAGPNVPPLPSVIGDWRPPSVYRYDTVGEQLTEISPNGQDGRPFDPRFISNTLGIRSAATLGDYVFFGGPAFTPTGSINIFLYHAGTMTYLGAKNLPNYNNIRKWLEVDGVLYAAVGKGDDGAVLRYTGNPANPVTRFDFVEVGAIGEDGAELALHNGRIFVNTWPSGFGGADIGGLWMSPPIPPGGLTAGDAGNWVKVFDYSEYEPDPLIARTYGGGALYSFNGDLYWGTMHVPFLATASHLLAYSDVYSNTGGLDEEDILQAMLGSQRSVTIFQGRNFGTPDQEIEVAYGMPELPAFDPNTATWSITSTLLGPPLYGLSGFDDMFNNYTWSMAVYDDQLFVGTMDWSYLVQDFLDSFINNVANELLGAIGLPLELEISLPDAIPGADLYRFYDTLEGALPESWSGVGNDTNYGIRNMIGREDGLYLGTANPMNLLTDLEDDKPEGGWELLRMTRHLLGLSVDLAGNGSGTVSSDVNGIDCGATCSAQFDYGRSVVLTAVPATGSIFTGWSGACYGTDPCVIDLFDVTEVTANFTLETHTLNVSVAGDGSGTVTSNPTGIHCGTACAETYNFGTQVTLTPIPEDGSVFTGWSGACSGSGACVVTIASATQVTANFANNRFSLVVNLVGAGSGLVSSVPAGIACTQASCSADFDDGTAVALSAIAFSGSSFGGWGGACSSSDACQVTIGPGTTVVTATFNQNPQQANLEVGGLPEIGSMLSFSATLNLNPITECEWDFGDGTIEPCDLDVAAAGAEATQDTMIFATHAYAQPGIYVVIVTASNDVGTAVAAQQITIQEPTNEEPTPQPVDPDNANSLFFPFLNRGE